MWTLERVKTELKNISFKMNDTFSVPVLINSRLTKTHGRCMFTINRISGYCEPTRIEISKQLLETTTDEDIIDILKHEWAHYYLTKTTHADHGHDYYFAEICLKIGCKHIASKGNVERTVSQASLYKYAIYCPNCGFLGGYQRMSNTLKNLSFCNCKKCGSKKLYYKQNR